MKIAISLLNFRSGKIGGMETYIRQLIQHLPGMCGEDRITIVSFRDNAAECRTPGVDQVVVDRSNRQIAAARVLEALTPYRARFAERAFNQLAPDVILFPQHAIFPKKVAAPCVVTIHDMQHLYYPQYFSLFCRLCRAAIYPYSLAKACHIISDSGFSKRTLIERCGVNESKITTVHLGAVLPDTSKVTPYAGFGAPYLYYPATSLPHKGHDVLLRCFAALKREGNFAYKLVFSGRQTELWPKLQQTIAQAGLGGEVIHQGYVSYDQVNSLYAGAAAVLFPTQFEGFGLPAVEAANFGKKVITSRLEVFDELGVPASCQIDFDKPQELRQALAQPGPTVLTRPITTWAQTTEQTLAVLRRAASK